MHLAAKLHPPQNGYMNPVIPRAVGIILAALLVASVTEWVLTLSARRTPAEPVRVVDAAPVESVQATDVTPVARLFGAGSASDVGGIRALGVMAEGGTGRGIAVLGIEGKPAKSYRSGDTVAPGVILKEVRKDGVVISRAGVAQELRLTKTPAPPPSPISGPATR
jgi:general secretion pathway protein C